MLGNVEAKPNLSPAAKAALDTLTLLKPCWDWIGSRVKMD